jgi:hypothetical protein
MTTEPDKAATQDVKPSFAVDGQDNESINENRTLAQKQFGGRITLLRPLKGEDEFGNLLLSRMFLTTIASGISV